MSPNTLPSTARSADKGGGLPNGPEARPPIERFYTRVAGVQHRNADGSSRQDIVGRCVPGERLVLVPEPDNAVDPDAVRVCRQSGEQLGYLPAHVARDKPSQIRSGWRFAVFVSELTGGTRTKPTQGMNLVVIAGRPEVAESEFEAAVRDARAGGQLVPTREPAVGMAFTMDSEKPSEKTATDAPDRDNLMNGLQPVPIKSPGFFGRLLKRKIPDNAYAEIQNLLAGIRIRDVPEDAVERILTEYELTVVDARPRLRELYSTVLGYFVQDQELTDAEVDDLRRLKHLLALTDEDIREIETAIIGGAYQRTLLAALADGRITPEEQTRLAQVAQRLRLPDAVAEEIRKRDGKSALEALLTRAVEDRQLSPDEEAQFEALAKTLDLEISFDAKTLAGLERFRLLWRIGQGDLPDTTVPIHLQRGEHAHFHVPASHHELRTVTKRIRYGGPSARIRIMKGVYWRVGDIGVQRVTEDVLADLDTGTLYLTNKRVIFDGANKTTSIPLAKIINFTLYSDAVRIEKSAGKDQVFKFANDTDVELLRAVLDAVLKGG